MTTFIAVACTLILSALVLWFARDFAHKLGHQCDVWPSDCLRCNYPSRVAELEAQLEGARNLAAASLQENVMEVDVRPCVTDADIAIATDSLLTGQAPRLRADCRGALTPQRWTSNAVIPTSPGGASVSVAQAARRGVNHPSHRRPASEWPQRRAR